MSPHGRRFSPRHRLHWQIFRALAITGLLCAVFAMVAAFLLRDRPAELPEVVQDVAAFVVDELPANNPAAFQRGLRRRARRLHASISVWNEHDELIARAGRRLEGPGFHRRRPWVDLRRGTLVRLEDGRSVAIALDRAPPVGPERIWIPLLLMGVALLLGSHWAAHRISRRLSLLETAVARFGQGELDVRASEQGQDEIARLAAAFNRSAGRIAGLLQTQRRMVQGASHELRSPLTRLRMALELLGDGVSDEVMRTKLTHDATRDIEELDGLIEELLLAARLEDTELSRELTPVDLTSLVQKEAERVGARTELSPLQVSASPRMMRSLVRNLLENARRHGREPIEVTLQQGEGQVVLTVDDAGDGVAEADRERIFEAFYRPQGAREGRGGGVGLGLSLVRNIARHHGGDVRYVAREHGSRFEARWPIKPAG